MGGVRRQDGATLDIWQMALANAIVLDYAKQVMKCQGQGLLRKPVSKSLVTEGYQQTDVGTNAYVHTYMHTYKYTCKHTHIHTNKNT